MADCLVVCLSGTDFMAVLLSGSVFIWLCDYLVLRLSGSVFIWLFDYMVV